MRAAVVALLFAACAAEPSLELESTGEVIQGPQGGFHLLVALTAGGLGEDPLVDVVVTDLGTGDVLDAFAPLRLPLDGQPRPVVLDIDDFADVEGHVVEIAATATGATGASASARLVTTCRMMLP